MKLIYPFFKWANNTWLATMINDSTWIFPALEGVHILALALLLGVASILPAGAATLRFAFQGEFKSLDSYSLNESFTLGMLGNVYEWCADAVEESLYTYVAGSMTDPVGHDRGSYRVYRGGSWYGYARNVRAASHIALGRGVRLDALGFRLAGGQASAPQ